MARKVNLAKEVLRACWRGLKGGVRNYFFPHRVAHLTLDEALVAEFCQKMRAMGIGVEESLEGAAMLAAAGASLEQIRVLAKIMATARITAQDLHQLERLGIRKDNQKQ